MTNNELQNLIADRLEDMAVQVERLYAEGNFAEAELLRTEGLSLAEAYDNEETFVVINDLSEVG